MINYNKNLRGAARKLRKQPTPAERSLWPYLRKKQLGGFQFYRQKSLSGFIVDFYCPAAKLVIELDGIHHYENQQAAYDTERDYQLMGLGLKVLRFSNWRVEHDIAGVLGEIREMI